MGFKNQKEFVEKTIEGGGNFITSYRRACNLTSNNGVWFDYAMVSGTPVAQFYASEPLVSAEIQQKNSLYVGPDIAPRTKHLHRILMTPLTGGTGVPVNFVLCDYLLYYPFIDGDSTDLQEMVNSVSIPRYENGEAVQMYLVAQGTYTGGGNVTVTYTNSKNISGRVSTTAMNQNFTTGNFATTGGFSNSSGPFLPLASGDTGIKSVESIQFSQVVSGIFCLVLVRPIVSMFIKEGTAPVERDYIVQHPSIPTIKDGAKLNFIGCPSGNTSGNSFAGLFETVIGD
jgi:hypothetical protein